MPSFGLQKTAYWNAKDIILIFNWLQGRILYKSDEYHKPSLHLLIPLPFKVINALKDGVSKYSYSSL